MNETPAVYIATNVVNGKQYVGATSIGFSKRKKRHLDRAKRDRACPRFYDAIKKYGPESFVWNILREFNSPPCAFSYERIAIAEIKPAYNVTSGGYGTPNHPAWNKIKIICLEDGIVHDSMTSAAKHYDVGSGDISTAVNGRTPTAAGGRHFIKYIVPMSAEDCKVEIDRLRENYVKLRRRRDMFGLHHPHGSIASGFDAVGRLANGPRSRSREIICVDTGQIFPSASDASRQLEIAKSAIIELCLGQKGRKTAGGLKFAYVGK